MLGSPAPNVTGTTAGQTLTRASTTTGGSSISVATDNNRLEQLAEQSLKSSSASTNLRLRLPDSSTPIRIAIDLNRTLADVRKFLSENLPSLQSSQFEFIEPPSTKIKREDETKSIAEAKLNNATLAIRRVS